MKLHIECIYKLDGKANNVEALNSIAKYAWQFGIGIDPNSNAKTYNRNRNRGKFWSNL